MKRLLILLAVFVLLLAALCLASCSCGGCSAECVEMKVNSGDCSRNFECSMCSDLSGCHVDCSCLECTWYPMYLGCAPRETSDPCGGGDGCTVPSCVVCGFDLLYCVTYDGNLGLKSYSATPATEGVDYEILDVTICDESGVYGELGEDLTDIDWSNILDAYMNNDYTAKVRYTVKYRANKDLAGVKLEIEGTKGGLFGSQNMHFSAHDGYGDTDYATADKAVVAGEHYIYVTMSLTPLEMSNMNIKSVDFRAYTFVEED